MGDIGRHLISHGNRLQAFKRQARTALQQEEEEQEGDKEQEEDSEQENDEEEES
jgi:Sec-independent protein translocase protein TatA